MSQVTTLVNAFGKMAGWNSLTSNFFGRDLEGIMELGYDDTVDKELIYGAGKMPIGYGEGNYAAKMKLVLVKEEVTAILDALPPGMRIQDAAPSDFIVQYLYDFRIYKDILKNVTITKLGRTVKQGDKVVGQEVEVILTHILWNQ
jgi:hypothetical protein